jgi:hypothetical protein
MVRLLSADGSRVVEGPLRVLGAEETDSTPARFFMQLRQAVQGFLDVYPKLNEHGLLDQVLAQMEKDVAKESRVKFHKGLAFLPDPKGLMDLRRLSPIQRANRMYDQDNPISWVLYTSQHRVEYKGICWLDYLLRNTLLAPPTTGAPRGAASHDASSADEASSR